MNKSIDTMLRKMFEFDIYPLYTEYTEKNTFSIRCSKKNTKKIYKGEYTKVVLEIKNIWKQDKKSGFNILANFNN